jgi:hypothetical protein
MNFIDAFETLVVAAIRAMGNLKALEYLRIRYVDLGKLVLPNLLVLPVCANILPKTPLSPP